MRSVNTNLSKEKSCTTEFFLCLFLGYLGFHRFYVGKIGTGLLYLFTFGLCGFGWFVDLLLILFKIIRKCSTKQPVQPYDDECEEAPHTAEHEKTIVASVQPEEKQSVSPPPFTPTPTLRDMEDDFEYCYRFAMNRFLNETDCKRMLNEVLRKRWGSENLPLIMQERYAQLVQEYTPKFSKPNPMLAVDNMNGHDFEHWCAALLRSNGFEQVSVTPGSKDQGVDVLAQKDGIKYAIQCKCYSHDLGNSPVQEVHTGKFIYHCHVGVVMTNRYFTDGAKEAAAATGVLLWNRDKLQELLKAASSQQSSAPVEPPPAHSDDLFSAAVEVVLETGQASVSMLQRRLKLGYSHAARLLDQLEERGIVGPFEGSNPRRLLIDSAKWKEMNK